ncbi:MAG TPA: mechanosensitive ion channel domain-containing protein [Xanthobacteraceae bacterium]|nr:mechanosensitive ion channel domain-containing protein [Xanthobacteraceae bacterium]
MTETFLEFLAAYPALYTFFGLVVLALAALLANFVVKKILIRLINHFLGWTKFGRDDDIRRQGVVERLANIMPAFVVAAGIALVPGMHDAAATVIRNVATAFIILTLAMALAAALNVADTLYRRRPQARLKPIKGYIQIAKIAIYVIAAVLMLATLMDRSPLILLSGLGAMAAVLILVFQDTLLSLVAGIQISSTDMVRVGDWIEMPSLNADGDVIEIALHTVRVRNWDNTVSAIPIRKLVTESFKNWRGMQESGGRRIKRAIYLDQTRIRFLGADEIERLGRFRHLESYLQRKRDELREWNGKLGDSAGIGANTRRITNVGTFRAYVDAYLRAHPGLHQHMTLLVRQLQPGPEGLPLEIYCFTNTTAWADYERIQSDIFDHLLALLPEFDLAVFQNPSGFDLRSFAMRPELSRAVTEA